MNKTGKQRLITLCVIATLGLLIAVSPTVVQAEISSIVPIWEIQGNSWTTPYAWDIVETTGIVTADYQHEGKRGFFLQDPIGDGIPTTSDGIFVYEPSAYDSWPYYGIFDVNVGDEISIVGRAREYWYLTQMDRVSAVTVLSTGNELPDSVELDPPFNDYDSNVYYEALEGMLVTIPDMKVVDGTNAYGEVGGVREYLGIDRVFRGDPAGTGELMFVDDGGGFELNVISGFVVRGLSGPLDYTYDEYKVLPARDAKPKVIPKGSGVGLGRGRAEGRGVSIATYNLYNLFDDIVDPGKLQTREASSLWTAEEVAIKLAKHARAIHDLLREPDLIAVQEVEKIELLWQLADTSPIEAEYGAVLVDGPDVRGIDVGLLYRKDRVRILGFEARQTCTTLDDDFGPGTDPNFPCPTGKNPLFSRPPLVVHLEILGKGKSGGSDLWLILNHFKSKSGGESATLPRRTEQAAHVRSLVGEIQADDAEAKVVVLGDLNDFEDSIPLEILTAGDALNDIILDIDKEERYTYIYRGASQILDHILIVPELEDALTEVRIVHLNTDYPYPLFFDDTSIGVCSSDHDVLMCFLTL
ncbi:MAG: endonuclease/exonuclease/phosphatase family protein [Candidatus Thorarchaeota archaeon]